MGLCKCPKRQVTNQFCFEHRVNVCEFCMVQSHPKCIVRSYIQWLKDNDYVSICQLCGISLEEGDCIRLICYHVFHWACIDQRQALLPDNTAPGGHTCPTCSHPIFPPSNLVSPIAEALKVRLSQVNWGRNELGLPLLSEERMEKIIISSQHASPNNQLNQYTTKIHSDSNKNDANLFNNNDLPSNNQHSVLMMDSFNSSDFQSNIRRPLLPRQSPIGALDGDENKYRRRTPSEIFNRWSRRFYAPSSRPPWRRTWFLILSGFIVFVILIYLMAHFGRKESDNSSDGSNDFDIQWDSMKHMRL